MKTRASTIVALTALWLGLAAASFAAPPSVRQATPDEKAFQEIKLLIFDEQWPEALERLDDFLELFPKSPLASQALYYRGKSLSRIDGREREAIAAFESYLALKDRSRSLVEDAENSIVDLSLRLYGDGDRSAVRAAEERLESDIRDVRYYAAVQLSYLKDKRIAVRAVPVLKEILRREPPGELRDRARIAMLRVAPAELESAERPREDSVSQMFHVDITDERTGRSLLSVSLPLSLADLVLGALPEEDLRTLKAKGYDVSAITKDLRRKRGLLLSIRDPDSLKTIKIWID